MYCFIKIGHRYLDLSRSQVNPNSDMTKRCFSQLSTDVHSINDIEKLIVGL